MFLLGIIYYLRIDICHTLQRWGESYAPIPNSRNGANWTSQGMAHIYWLAEKDKCLWHPFIPAAQQTAPSCSPHTGEAFLLTVSGVEDDSRLRLWAHTFTQNHRRANANTNPWIIYQLYGKKQRLICSLDPVTQHLCNGNLIACWFTFTRKWRCLWEQITLFLTGKANYLSRVCFIFHTPSSVGLTHAHLRAHYLLIDVRALCV